MIPSPAILFGYLPVPAFVHERVCSERSPFMIQFEFPDLAWDERIEPLWEQHPVKSTLPMDEVDGR